MRRQMIWRQNAVAIGKQQILSATCPHTIIAAFRNAIVLVRVRCDFDAEVDGLGKHAHYTVRFILRAVVSNHDFESPGDTSLERERRQAAFQVPRTLVRG
jgi:hypothetical protein